MSPRNTTWSRAFMELTVVQEILSKAKESDVDNPRHTQAASPEPETMLSNPEAFAGMVRLYYGQIYFTALSIVRDGETAQDIVQETFLRAWLKRDTVQQPAVQLLPWLGRIARNLAIQWQRQGQRRSRLLPVLSLEEIMVDPADPTQPHPRDAAVRTEQTVQVVSAVMELPEDLRQVVLLHYGDGLTPADIARLTGEARSTITRRLARAHKKLRVYLDDGLTQGLATLKPSRLQLERTCAIAGAVATLPAAGRAQLLRDIADTPMPPMSDAVAAGIKSGGAKSAATGLLSGISSMKAVVAGVVIVIGFATYALREDVPQRLMSSVRGNNAGAVQPAAISSDHQPVTGTRNSTRTYTKQYRRSGDGSAAPVVRKPAEYGPLPALNRKVDVRGKVIDPAGNPVAGAVVQPSGSYRHSPAVADKVITAVDGSFHIRNVSPGNINLQARAKGFAPVVIPVQAPADDLVLSLKGTGASLAGRVINDATGEPVSGTTVSLHMTYSKFPVETPVAVSSAAGDFILEDLLPGEYILNAEAPGLGMMPEKPGWLQKRTQPIRTYTLDEGDRLDDVKVRMYAGHTLTGVVTEGGTEKPIGGVTVQPIDFNGAPVGASVQTDASGRYRLDGVTGAASRVWLKLSKPGFVHSPKSQYGDPNSPMFDLPDTLSVNRDFVLEPAVLVSGVIQDETGHPVTPAQLVLHDELGSSIFTTDAAGRYELSIPLHRNVIMSVYSSGFPSQEVLLSAGDEPITRDVILQRGVTAGGVVLSAAGQPIEGAVVEARMLPPQVENQGSVTTYGNEKTVAVTITDENGRFAVGNLPRENVVLVASGKDYAPGRAGVDFPDGVDVVDEAIIELSGGAEIHGIVKAPDGLPLAGAQVQLYGFDAMNNALYTETNAEGIFTFTSLAPRRATLQVGHYQYGTLSSSDVMPGPDQIELVYGGPGSYRDYRVTVVDGQTGKQIRDYEIVESLGQSPIKQDDGTFIQRIGASEKTNYLIRAEGYALLNLRNFQVPDYQSSPTFTLVMGPGVTIRGELAWPDDQTTAPLAGITVRAGATNDRNDDIVATTDASGHFELNQVPAGKAEVFIEPAPPCTPVVRAIEATDGESLELGRIYLETGITVQGHLRTAEGAGLADVEVEISELNRSPRKTTTDATGFYRFDGMGHRDYWMKIPSHNLGANLSLEANRGTGGKQKIITRNFQLGTGIVRGRIQQTGGPVVGANITMIHDDGPRWETKSSAGGRFALENVAAGEYLLMANRMDNSSGRAIVRVADGETTSVEVDLDSGRVRGKIVDAAGVPVGGLYVSLTRRHPEPRLRSAYSVISGNDGTYNMGVPSGYYAAVASLDGRIMTKLYNITVPPNGLSDELVMRVTDETGSIVSVTHKADGSPRRDVKTQITVVDVGTYHRFDHDRDAAGVLTIDDLPPGRYKVWLSADGGKSVAHEVEVSDGGIVYLEDVLD